MGAALSRNPAAVQTAVQAALVGGVGAAGVCVFLCAKCRQHRWWDELKLTFDACDTSGSKGLDNFDLWFALNGLGLYPEQDQLRSALCSVGEDADHFLAAEGRELNINIVRQLVAHLLKSGNCIMRPKALPYAQRGIMLSQLRSLTSAYVDAQGAHPGWFIEACQGEVPNLYEFNKLVVKPVTCAREQSVFFNAGGHSSNAEERARRRKYAQMRAQIPRRCKAAAGTPYPPAHDCSYAQLLNPKGKPVDYFVSHWWGHELSRTAKSLETFAITQLGKHSSPELDRHPGIENTVFWICLFALNQHASAQELRTTPDRGPFNAALAKASKGMVMVLDKTVQPLRRIWCLFEVDRVHKHKGMAFCLVTDEGPLGGIGPVRLQRSLSDRISLDGADEVAESLQELSAYKAEATLPEDKLSILFRIKDEKWNSLSYSSFRDKIQSKSKEKALMFHDFDTHVKALLSTPMLHAMLWNSCRKKASFDKERAIKHIMLGATYNEDDIATLRSQGCNLVNMAPQKVAWAKNVELTPLHVHAYFGHLEQAEWILDRKADAACMSSDKRRPLHFASGRGHLAVVKLLLNRRASANDKDQYGRTGLHLAAECSQPSIAQLLISEGAEIGAAAEVGAMAAQDALHMAVEKGHSSVATCLLDNKAMFESKSVNQHTLLHQAAKNGHYALSEKLIACRACVFASDKGGKIPLHWAASDGHIEVTALLVNKFADVNHVDKNGESALHLAASEGHPGVVEELLRLKANVLLESNRKRTALQMAVRQHDYDVALHLVKSKALTTQEQGKDLLRLIKKKNPKLVELLTVR